MSSTITSPASTLRPPASIPDFPVWRMSVYDYQRMIEEGILTDEDHVEFLEGVMVPTMPKNPAHAVMVGCLQDILAKLLPRGWHIRVQDSLTLDHSVPEPDVCVVKGERRAYLAHHPTAVNVSIVIEVSDLSLESDRQLKQRVYARNGLAEYWIVNLVDRQIEVYTRLTTDDAAASTYQDRRDYRATDELPLRIGGVDLGSIPVASILP